MKVKHGAHSAEDVPIYAAGPWAHLLVGVIDNTLVSKVAAYAACIGPFSGDKCFKHAANTDGGDHEP